MKNDEQNYYKAYLFAINRNRYKNILKSNNGVVYWQKERSNTTSKKRSFKFYKGYLAQQELIPTLRKILCIISENVA